MPEKGSTIDFGHNDPSALRIAVVTGGGGGIGRALVRLLVQCGAELVFVADRDGAGAEATATAVGDAALAVALDATDAAAVAALVDRIEREHGPIDAWFSNAGVNRGEGLGDAADWRLTLDVNLMAHVHAAHALLPRMEARGAGRFIITASAAGLLTDLRAAPYSASKHAAVGLAEWLAIGAAEGVSIHCACPEGVLTAMTRPDSRNAAAGIGFLQPEEVAGRILDGVAAGNFLILTHPCTAEFEQRRAGDRSRWIAGMRRARQRALMSNRIFPLIDAGAM